MVRAKKTAPFGQSRTINPFPRPLLVCVCQPHPNGPLELTQEVLVSEVKWIIIVNIGNDNKFTEIILFPVFADNSEPRETPQRALIF